MANNNKKKYASFFFFLHFLVVYWKRSAYLYKLLFFRCAGIISK